jgi:hypothetical protein
MSIKDIEELKDELANLKEKNRALFQKNSQTVIKVKIQEFLHAFEDYFRERGFVIRKKEDSVRAAFDTLHFKAFTNESHDIFIMKGKEQIASITVSFKGARKSGDLADPQDNFEELTVQLEREIEKEKTLSSDLENPVFYSSGGEFGHPYDSPLTVLESIFQS